MTPEITASPHRYTPGLVSVVMAARDAGRWIADALASVALQDYPSIEAIVVDDGSHDDTALIAAQFADRLPLRIIREHGRGPAAARNRGLDAASGEFIQFLDADDAIESTKISLQFEFARTTGSDVVWGSFERAFDAGEGLAAARRITVEPILGNDAEADLISSGGFVPLASALIRRSGPLGSVRMPEHMRVLEDIQYHFALIAAGAVYRRQPGSSGLIVREHSTPTRASLASAESFWRACVENAIDRESKWHANGTLSRYRRRILASIYVYAARELAAVAPQSARDAAGRARHVDERYFDFVSPRLRLPTRVFGLYNVERLASFGRSFRRAMIRRP